MNRRDAEHLARLLYKRAITEAGYQHPTTYEDALLIFLSHNADIAHCPYLPPGFPGVQIGETLYVNANAGLAPEEMTRFLAHEFCHYMRRNPTLWPGQIRFYRLGNEARQRDAEEMVARAFERLF